MQAIDTFIPKKYISNTNNTPWMTPHFKQLKKEAEMQAERLQRGAMN